MSKLAVLTCRLEFLERPWTSAAPDEELESAWKGVWFPVWSPTQSRGGWRSALFRSAFQSGTARLHHANGRVREHLRGEKWNARGSKSPSPRISLGIVTLDNFWLGEVRLRLYRYYKEWGYKRARGKWLSRIEDGNIFSCSLVKCCNAEKQFKVVKWFGELVCRRYTTNFIFDSLFSAFRNLAFGWTTSREVSGLVSQAHLSFLSQEEHNVTWFHSIYRTST